MPRGVISNREYTTEDIFSPIVYPRMKEEPLLDDDDCLVVPVRNEDNPGTGYQLIAKCNIFN